MDQQYYGGGQPVQQQVYQQPQPVYMQQQVPQQNGISGGAKAGMFCSGMFLGCIGIIIMYFFSRNRSDSDARECAKWTMFGMIANIAFTIILVFFIMIFAVSLFAGIAAVG